MGSEIEKLKDFTYENLSENTPFRNMKIEFGEICRTLGKN